MVHNIRWLFFLHISQMPPHRRAGVPLHGHPRGSIYRTCIPAATPGSPQEAQQSPPPNLRGVTREGSHQRPGSALSSHRVKLQSKQKKRVKGHADVWGLNVGAAACLLPLGSTSPKPAAAAGAGHSSAGWFPGRAVPPAPGAASSAAGTQLRVHCGQKSYGGAGLCGAGGPCAG